MKKKLISWMLLTILTCICTFVPITASAETYTPVATVEWNGHKYQLFDESMTWQDAKAYCENLGGHLVTITSEEEQKVIEKLVDNGKKNQYWIGIRNFEKKLKWVTDEKIVYTNWDKWQPDASTKRGYNEEYGQILRIPDPYNNSSLKYKWNDMYNDNVYPGEEDIYSQDTIGFICEFGDINKTLFPVATTEWNGHKYHLFDESMTWEEAKAYCERIGGHLATITSEEEQSIVGKLTDNGKKLTYWLGAKEFEDEGSWQWVTSEKWHFEYWDPGEPNNGVGNEIYLQLLSKRLTEKDPAVAYMWNDVYEHPTLSSYYSFANSGFICEWENISSKYEVIEKIMSWQDAKAYCENLGGHLLTINSEEEQKVIEKLLESYGNNDYFIGLHKELDDFNTWVTGENVTYSNWGLNEPDNMGGQDCGIIANGVRSGATYHIEKGQWDDIAGSYYFICEWDNVLSDFELTGEAVYDSKENAILLCPAKTWSGGKAIYVNEIPQNFEIQFDYKIGGGTSADGIVLAFYAKKNDVNATGINLNFEGCGGYGLELDTYYNSQNSDSKNPHIAITYDKVSNHLAMIDNLRIDDENWHTSKLIVNGNHLEVYNDNQKILEKDIEFDKTGKYLYFAATTGTATDNHFIKNIQIKTLDAKKSNLTISAPTNSYAGTYYTFEATFDTMPTNAFLQFDSPADGWEWLSEENCNSNPVFNIPTNEIIEKDGKYLYKKTFIISSPGNEKDNYNRKVRVVADINGKRTYSEDVKFFVGLPNDNVLTLAIGESRGYIGDKMIDVPAAPYISNERTLIPLRTVAENLGAMRVTQEGLQFSAKVDWDEETKTITVTNGNTIAKYKINSTEFTVKGTYYDEQRKAHYTETEITFSDDVAPILNENNNSTYIPLRKMCEVVFGRYVQYIDNKSQYKEGVIVICPDGYTMNDHSYYTELINPHTHQYVSKNDGNHSCSVCKRTWKCDDNGSCKKCGYAKPILQPTVQNNKNVMIDESFLLTLYNDDIYYAAGFKDKYKSAGQQLAIWLGNNVYGDNHSNKIIYINALSEFFDDMNRKQNKTIKAQVTLDYAINTIDNLEKFITIFIESGKYISATAETKEIQTLLGTLTARKMKIYENAQIYYQTPEALLKEIDDINKIVEDLMKRNKTLKKILEQKDAVIDFGAKGLPGIAKKISVGVTLYQVIIEPAQKVYGNYMDFIANASMIQDNIYLLDAIISYTDNYDLKEAAKEMKEICLKNMNETYASFVKLYGESVAGNAVFEFFDTAVEYIPYVKWLKWTTDFASVVLPIDDMSKTALEAYGFACIADCLSKDMEIYLGGNKQLHNGKNAYILYGDKAEESLDRVINLIYSRIAGEDKVYDLQMNNDGLEPLIKNMREFWLGYDGYKVAEECIDTTNELRLRIVEINKYRETMWK